MVLYIIFISALFVQVIFYVNYLFFFNRKSKYNLAYKPSVSIIICAKNEAENLKNNIPKIAKQNYSPFEIIILDDNSSDNTAQVVAELKEVYSNIQYIKIDNKIGVGKKYLLQQGMHIAKYDVLLFTDADCFPVSENWIANMSAHLFNYEIVLGISPYKATKVSLLSDIQHYETTQTYLQYIAFANAGIPYMCVGRNVMVTKSLYQKIQWNDTDFSLASGDDDLMIQQLANMHNTNTCVFSDSFTYSKPKNTYMDWCKQKLRHYTTGTKYKPKHQVLLALFLWSKLCVYVAFLICFFQTRNIYVVFALMIYFMVSFVVFYKIDKFYRTVFGFFKVMYSDCILIFNIVILGIASNIVHSKNKWI
jgi:glycosyltransferase involved in cell wall biosynthesis